MTSVADSNDLGRSSSMMTGTGSRRQSNISQLTNKEGTVAGPRSSFGLVEFESIPRSGVSHNNRRSSLDESISKLAGGDDSKQEQDDDRMTLTSQPQQYESRRDNSTTPLWPAEPTRYQAFTSLDLDSGHYLTDFYTNLLKEIEDDCKDVLQKLIFHEMEVRKRLYTLANADMFRVRFLEEARWELRERFEVIARREALDRSRLERELLELIREHLVCGGGEWSEDAQRARIEVEEELGFREIENLRRSVRKQLDEEEWERHLMAEDRWRWDVELTVRHGMHQIQLHEHRHRSYIETELYPQNLNKLMHAMELEWVELLKVQSASLANLVDSTLTKITLEETSNRNHMKKAGRRVHREFSTLHRMLEVQHYEESERDMLEETADRLFNVLFSKETMQIRALLDRTRLLNESVSAALAERAALTHTFHGWGGEVYPELVSSPVGGNESVSSLMSLNREKVVQMKEAELARQQSAQQAKENEFSRRMDDLLKREAALDVRSQVSQPFLTPVGLGSDKSIISAMSPDVVGSYQSTVPRADIEAAAALLNF